MWSCQKINRARTMLEVSWIRDRTTDESNHRGGNRWGYDFAGYNLPRVAICRTCWCWSEYSHSFHIELMACRLNTFTFTESPIQALISLSSYDRSNEWKGNVVYPKGCRQFVRWLLNNSNHCFAFVNRWKSLWFSRMIFFIPILP